MKSNDFIMHDIRLLPITDMIRGTKYTDQFKVLYWQCRRRYADIINMINAYKNGNMDASVLSRIGLPEYSLEIIKDERVALSRYLDVLEKRAKHEGIDLGETRNQDNDDDI